MLYYAHERKREMKKLLSFILALSLMGSLTLPALAEGTGDFVACTVSDGCTFADGHTEPCNVPEPKVCETGCLLEAGHEGDCRLREEGDGDAGVAPVLEEDPEPVNRILYAFYQDAYVTEISVDDNDPPLSVQFFYYADGEVPLVLDDSATFTVTDPDGNTVDGIVMEKNDEYPSLYTISFSSAAPYRLVCTMEGAVIGCVDLYVNTGSGGDVQIPLGLSMRVEDKGEVHYYNGTGATVGQTGFYNLYYDGQQLEDPDAPLVYDPEALRVEKLNWGWEITPLVPGEHTVNYEGNTNGYLRIFAEERATVNVENPPSDLSGLHLCWMENGQRKWGNNLSVSGEFSGTLVYVHNGESTIVTDGNSLIFTPSEGLNRRLSNGVLQIQGGSKAGSYVITYTHTDGTASHLVVNYNSSSGPNLENPPVSPGMYFCWNQNGQVQWSNKVNFSGEFGATLVLVKTVDGNKTGSVLNDGSKLSVSPDNGGLEYVLYSDGICRLKGIKGGSYTLIYTDDDGTAYEVTANYNDGSVNLDDAPTDPGLYHVIFDNFYFFTGEKGVTMNNGFGQTFGPLILVKDNGEKLQLTDPALLDISAKPYLTVSPRDGMTLDYNAMNKSWVMKAKRADLYTISYVDVDDKVYTATVTIWERGQLYASVDGGANWQSILHVTEDEPIEVEFAWKNSAGKYIKTMGTTNGSNDQLHITRNMNTGISTLVVDNPNVNANVGYHYDDYHSYMMQVISHEAYRLALKTEKSQTPVYDYIGEVGSQIPVEMLFGQPSQGLKPYGGALTVSEGIVLEDNNATGAYVMKILKEGKHTISFKHACNGDCPNVCDIAGKTFTVNVEGIPKSSGGAFFALKGASSTPVFGSEMMAGETQTLRLCYGSYGNYTVLSVDQLKVEGNAVTLSQNGEAVDVEYNENGQSLIQYVDGDDIVHNYVVKCYTGMAELGMAHYSEQGHNTFNLTYQGKTVTVGPALRTNEKMWMWPGNSFNHSEEEDWDIYDEVVIGAMYAGEGNSVTEPLDAAFFSRISNMNMSLLYCQNTAPNPDGGNNVVIEPATTVSWKGRTLQMQKFQGKKGQYFEAGLMISFDLQLDDGKHRFYRPADLSYRALPDDKVTVDITDADVLNTLLSNSYTLINYLEANVEGFKYGGGNLTLTLPAVTYDKILVSQLILPGSSDVLGVFTIRGSEEGGKRTTVPGIYSKGFLYGVENLSFVADPDAPMTFGGETFTCGLLVNNTRATIQPTFDLETLRLYHPEFQGLSDADAQNKFSAYYPSVSTNGNSYNLGSIRNCSFDGFEYAMRTDAGGFVQGAHGCTIRHCKYGVYINAGGVDTLHTDGRANTIWRDNQFIENWVAVRITGLPKDLSPYYIRFIDNRFWRNGTDFGVTCPGRFYFYRNYYSGLYPFGGWGISAAAAAAEAGGEGARAANLSVSDGTVLVTNPCRSEPDSVENLWIFDTDNLQNTVILQSEADGLQVDPGAITDLGGTLDIPVLNDKEESVGVWTIYEGGAAE